MTETNCKNSIASRPFLLQSATGMQRTNQCHHIPDSLQTPESNRNRSNSFILFDNFWLHFIKIITVNHCTRITQSTILKSTIDTRNLWVRTTAMETGSEDPDITIRIPSRTIFQRQTFSEARHPTSLLEMLFVNYFQISHGLNL